MRRFPEAAARRVLQGLGPSCWALASITACTAPAHFARTSTAPAPSAISGGPTVATHAPATGRRSHPAPPPPVPLYPDEIKVGAPWCGLQLAMAPALQGILVGMVSRDSPAEASGIQAGDFIFELSGQPVSDAREILAEVARVGIGGSMRFGVRRGARVRLFRVEVIAKPAAAPAEKVSTRSTLTDPPSATLEQSRRSE